jgi:putative glycosyltransferase
MRISVVTTLYHSAPYIQEFYSRVTKTLQGMSIPFEMIFVDDGSPDNSSSIVRNLMKTNKNIKLVVLSRNFGHFKAILTGLSFVESGLIFLIDSDLEESPELLPTLYERMKTAPPEDPIDIVRVLQNRRKGGWFERITGALFYSFFNWITQVKIPRNEMSTRLMTKRYVKSLLLHHEKEIYLSGLLILTGYRQEMIYAQKGSKGKTTYTFEKKLALTLDAITSFSRKPLIFIFLLGTTISFFSMGGIVCFLLTKFIWGLTYLSGWSSVMLTVCFFGGMSLASIGVVGIYLGKVFIEVKNRPCIVKDVFPKTKKSKKILDWSQGAF